MAGGEGQSDKFRGESRCDGHRFSVGRKSSRGEAGRGFAVVAEEVRKLAERSAAATSDIDSLVRVIQADTQEAVSSMDASLERVEDGVEGSGRARDSLEKIITAITTTQSESESISAASEELAASSTEVENSMGQLAHGVESNSAASEELAAQTDELSGHVSNVADTADELQQLVDSGDGRNGHTNDAGRAVSVEARALPVGPPGNSHVVVQKWTAGQSRSAGTSTKGTNPVPARLSESRPAGFGPGDRLATTRLLPRQKIV